MSHKVQSDCTGAGMGSSCADTAASSKRTRNINYSNEEKTTIICLVNKYKHIIENKKTDATTNNEKEKIWIKIASEFNAISPNNVFREVQSLKKAYINMKKIVRKEVADEKIELKKTGGGLPLVKNHNTLTELTLDTINEKTVHGMTSRADSDFTLELPSGKKKSEDCLTHKYIECDEYYRYQFMVPTTMFRVVGSQVTETSTHGEDDEDIIVQYDNNDSENIDWCDMKAQNFKQPISTPLANGTPWASRRRPTVAMHSTEISKIYTELGQKRLEIAILEKNAMECKMKRDDVIHTINKRILETELEIKLEQLKKIKLQSSQIHLL